MYSAKSKRSPMFGQWKYVPCWDNIPDPAKSKMNLFPMKNLCIVCSHPIHAFALTTTVEKYKAHPVQPIRISLFHSWFWCVKVQSRRTQRVCLSVVSIWCYSLAVFFFHVLLRATDFSLIPHEYDITTVERTYRASLIDCTLQQGEGIDEGSFHYILLALGSISILETKNKNKKLDSGIMLKGLKYVMRLFDRNQQGREVFFRRFKITLPKIKKKKGSRSRWVVGERTRIHFFNQKGIKYTVYTPAEILPLIDG